MSIESPIRRLRIPMHLIEDVWECTLGGKIPVKNGTRAELLVDQHAIEDKFFLEQMMRTDRHKVLEEHTKLLVALTIKSSNPPRAEIMALARPQEDFGKAISFGTVENWSPVQFHFVEVKIGGPDERQRRIFGTREGGLWLLTKGLDAVGLASTTVVLPDEISKDPVGSLNHAFTKLSENFENWRISHTGNIYKRVLYQEENGSWYPLDCLRSDALNKTEMAIATKLWLRFLETMRAPCPPPRRP